LGSAAQLPNGKLMDMQGGFMIRHSQLAALGILLCLLAALFALEAKIAWFSPSGTARAQISYDKASPAEPSKAVLPRLVSSAPPAYDLSPTAAFVAAALFTALASIMVVRLAPARPKVHIRPGFSSALLYRPPPVL
jgi:hypothetical protein